MRSANRYSICLSALLVVMVHMSATADTVTGRETSGQHTLSLLKSNGRFVVADGVNNDGLGTSKFKIPGRNLNKWEFYIKHKTNPDQTKPGNPHWIVPPAVRIGGANQFQSCIQVKHIIGPHKQDKVMTQLTEYCGNKKNLAFGPAFTARHAMFINHIHPLTIGGKHFDNIAVITSNSALLVPNNNLTGHEIASTYKLFVSHTEKKKVMQPPKRPKQKGSTIGFSANGGSFVHYDHTTGYLNFHPGALDIADHEGGVTNDIAEVYLEDPVLWAKLEISPLKLTDINSDGDFIFSSGGLSLYDPEQQFELNGTMSELIIDPSTVDSASLLDALFIDDNFASGFIDDFLATNLLGEGLTEEELAEIQGIGLTLVTETNLVEATEGFENSAELPVTILISLLQSIEDDSATE